MDKFNGVSMEQLVGIMLQVGDDAIYIAEIKEEIRSRFSRMEGLFIIDYLVEFVFLACVGKGDLALFGTAMLSGYASRLTQIEQSWIWARVATDAKLTRPRRIADANLQALWHEAQLESPLAKKLEVIQTRLERSIV